MPKIKNKSKQYLFKNKLNIRRKSKRELIKESIFMMILGSFLLLINYFIPQKIFLLNSLKKNIFNIFSNIFEIFFYSFEIIKVLIICLTLLCSIFLFLGSINRIVKVLNRKSKKNRIW